MSGAGLRGVGRTLALAVGSLGLCAVSRPVGATGPEEGAQQQPKTATDWLSWAPPPECPGPEFVSARVQSWLGGQVPGDVHASGEVLWTGSDWEIRVVVLAGEGKGERRVRVASCGDAAEFLAVAIVLAVDPTRASELPVEVGGAATEVAAEVRSEQADPPEVAKSEPEAIQSDATAGSFDRVEQPKTRPFWFLGAGIEGSSGALPYFQIGPYLEGGLQHGLLVLGLGAHVLPPVSQRPEGAVADIRYALAAGRVGACLLAHRGIFDFGPCAHLDVGALWTNQSAPGDTARVVPWVDVQAGLLARVFGPRWSLSLGARVAVPLTQPRFLVSSGELVHQPGWGVALDLGVQVFLGRR